MGAIPKRQKHPFLLGYIPPQREHSATDALRQCVYKHPETEIGAQPTGMQYTIRNSSL